jgi:hypothetical protein
MVALDPLHWVRTATAFFSLFPNTASVCYCLALTLSSVQLAQITVQVAGDKGAVENGVRVSEWVTERQCSCVSFVGEQR